MALNDLLEVHKKNGNTKEIIYGKILQAAIVLEYCTITGRMTNDLCNQHPALEFVPNCYLAKTVVCPPHFMQDLPIVPGWADSPFFNDLGFLSLMHEIIDLCISSQNYEPAVAMIDIIWPMLERRRLYGQLENLFHLSNKLFNIAASLPPHNSDAMADVFFSVKFDGEIFGIENGKTFVFCEKRLTHLYDFSKTLLQKYKNVFGENEIVLMTGDGEKEKNPEKGYVHITHASPYFGSKGVSRPTGTTLGLTTPLSRFYSDTPFVKGEKKLQGTVESQWIRRTILTTVHALPSIVERAQVLPDRIQVIEYEPIRVAYRAIRDRVQALERAIEVKNWPELGQLLHGSLLAQVNEGPTKIAEVFLTKGPESKRKQKMRLEFSRFSSVLVKATKLHGEWVTTNPEFVPLQVQLENSLESFISMLSNYVEICIEHKR